MGLIVCGKRDARAVLVLYKYCPYFRDFVGICSNLILIQNVWWGYKGNISRNPLFSAVVDVGCGDTKE